MVRVPKFIPNQLHYVGKWDPTYRSKCALRLFSIANQTMIPRANHMIHPVTPGPVAELRIKNPPTPLLDQLECAWIMQLMYLFCAMGRSACRRQLTRRGNSEVSSLRSYAYVLQCASPRRILEPMLPVLNVRWVSKSSCLPVILTVKGDILVKWDDGIEGCTSKERDEVPTHGEKDEDDIDCYVSSNCISGGWLTCYVRPEPIPSPTLSRSAIRSLANGLKMVVYRTSIRTYS